MVSCSLMGLKSPVSLNRSKALARVTSPGATVALEGFDYRVERYCILDTQISKDRDRPRHETRTQTRLTGDPALPGASPLAEEFGGSAACDSCVVALPLGSLLCITTSSLAVIPASKACLAASALRFLRHFALNNIAADARAATPPTMATASTHGGTPLSGLADLRAPLVGAPPRRGSSGVIGGASGVDGGEKGGGK